MKYYIRAIRGSYEVVDASSDVVLAVFKELNLMNKYLDMKNKEQEMIDKGIYDPNKRVVKDFSKLFNKYPVDISKNDRTLTSRIVDYIDTSDEDNHLSTTGEGLIKAAALQKLKNRYDDSITNPSFELNDDNPNNDVSHIYDTDVQNSATGNIEYDEEAYDEEAYDEEAYDEEAITQENSVNETSKERRLREKREAINLKLERKKALKEQKLKNKDKKNLTDDANTDDVEEELVDEEITDDMEITKDVENNNKNDAEIETEIEEGYD